MLRIRSRRHASDTGRPIWSVLALLLLAVLIPTAGLLWYMNQARVNEEAAVRLRLTEAYRDQLQSAALGLQQHWRLQEEALSREGANRPPPERFAELIASGRYDSAVLLDAAGRVVYPEASAPLDFAPTTDSDDWRAARKAEFETKDWADAARLYATIARSSTDVHRSAQAWQGRARSLLKAGADTQALTVLTQVLTADRYRDARDEQGRWIVPSALLLALERMPDRTSERFRGIADLLEEHLRDYRVPTLPSSQRRFIWKQLRTLDPQRPSPPLLLAEELALAAQTNGLPPAGISGLVPSGTPTLWAFASSDRRVIVFFREARLTRDLESQVRAQTTSTSLRWEIRPPTPAADVASSELTRRLPEPLRDWELVLKPTGSDPFSVAARQGVLFRVWTAILAIASVVLLTFVTAQRVTRQMHSTRLKDDLLATVSHELKTPLSSMRVLVDTLLAGSIQDPQQQREYLEIITRENHRLTGLIENFLAFSRMERGRHVFEFSRVHVADVVDRAITSAGDRVRAPACRLDVAVEPDLSSVQGDRDALVTVVLNLVDNALKYSGSDKHIVVRGYQRERHVCLEVEDNGIGFSRRVGRRIFERFFQADRDMAGSAAGVGLGLSIVKYIVNAHHGKIDVSSQPGKGSRFTICLPAANA
jgi:signal transduction histidine kinase